ncbi:hypothetical protein C6988_07740 [Nitrosopumilus sp. b1]|uniref:hypothetical protein n=1 Tax=Nitrosopumilus sp. b1 TaxID=2109907 RepID=UPI0015F4FF5F|nr:hypothetical protein [Nitrosopumilus sp. b1]KAF6242560.1 hypothetical protein C6988_07740 [Nitrosopumilus sp. b1]
MAEEYIGICAACTKGVTRDNMKYVIGRLFHPECYQKHGKDFLAVDQELAAKTAKLKIDLIQLKNLKSRRSGSKKASSTTTKRKSSRKSTKKTKRKTAKTRRSKPKSRTTKRKTAKTRRSKPKSRTKRKTSKTRR